MTPQLQQAIKLLQLSRAELEELIEQTLIENPVLEEGIGGADAEKVVPVGFGAIAEFPTETADRLFGRGSVEGESKIRSDEGTS